MTEYPKSSSDEEPPVATTRPYNKESDLVEPLVVHGVEIPSNQEQVANNDANKDSEFATDDQVFGAGVAGAILGLLLGGPIVAAIAGIWTARAAKSENGNVAQAMGNVSLTVRDKYFR